MTIGTVKTAGTAYQGSGPDNSVGQSAPVKETIRVVKAQEPRISSIPEERNIVKAKESRETENGTVEVKESGRNESMKRAVDEINRKSKNSEAIFGIHDETNRVMIKIVNKETKEVIKEYPPEQTLDMIAKVWELAGLMIDEKG